MVAVKDTIDIAGLRTRAGSAALEDTEPAMANADVVDALLQADCKIVGKLCLHELAFGMTGVNHHSGTPINFSYPDYIPGGSSSGSAVAVAEGDIDFSLGTDTGGSIRVPAACCGVFGFKPTFGRVSRRGIMPAQTSIDCVGPLARSAEKIITAMQVIDGSFKRKDKIENITLGRVFVDVSDDVQNPVDALLDACGLQVIATELPSMDLAFDAGLALINYETWAACGHLLDTGKVGPDVAQRLVKAQETSRQQIVQAEMIREQFSAEVDAALQRASVLVTPTLPTFPLLRSEALAGKADLNISRLVRPFNVSGHPAISIPLSEPGRRPVAMQLVANKGEDEMLCEVARVLSQFIA